MLEMEGFKPTFVTLGFIQQVVCLSVFGTRVDIKYNYFVLERSVSAHRKEDLPRGGVLDLGNFRLADLYAAVTYFHLHF